MTQQEAKELAKQGKKITHYYFTDDEYIEIKNGIYYFEDNVKVPDDWWNKKYLQLNWREYKTN